MNRIEINLFPFSSKEQAVDYRELLLITFYANCNHMILKILKYHRESFYLVQIILCFTMHNIRIG